jgi:hypothetical protein
MKPFRSLCLLLALSSCRHTGPAPLHADVTASTQAREASAARPPTPAPTTELLALVDETATRIAELRGLAVRQPIARGVMDRGQIVARLRQRAAEEYPPGEIALEAETLRRLGMIPEEMDYEATVFALLEEQVAGFYDPSARHLYLAAWVQPALQQVTLSHEIVHALQDQHFDIGRFVRHERGGGDAQMAAMAVVEGDATLTMTQDAVAMAAASGAEEFEGDQSRLMSAPRALRESLIFPYREGAAMCARLVRAGGFAAIDALLRNPPQSTEQVLHPDKLAAREPPLEVPAHVPAPLAADYTLAYDDVMGELGAKLYLQAALPDPIASDAAAGWGGDRAMLLVPRAGGDGALRESVLVWKLVFDPAPGRNVDAEAAAFERAAIRVLTARYPQASARAIPGTSRALETAPGRMALVARAGRTVLVLDRAPADRAGAIVQATLAPAAP